MQNFVFLIIVEVMYELILKNIFINDIKSATYIYIYIRIQYIIVLILSNGITQFNYIYYNVNASIVIISMVMETSYLYRSNFDNLNFFDILLN